MSACVCVCISPVFFPMTDPLGQVAVGVVPRLDDEGRGEVSRNGDLDDPNPCYVSARSIGFTIWSCDRYLTCTGS